MHLLVARVGEHNAVVVSQKTMAKIMGRHVNTVKTAFKTLRDRNWIEICQVGERGTVNAYIINDPVAWTGKREGLRYSLSVPPLFLLRMNNLIATNSAAKTRFAKSPSLLHGEQQLPTGDGSHPRPLNQVCEAWSQTFQDLLRDLTLNHRAPLIKPKRAEILS